MVGLLETGGKPSRCTRPCSVLPDAYFGPLFLFPSQALFLSNGTWSESAGVAGRHTGPGASARLLLRSGSWVSGDAVPSRHGKVSQVRWSILRGDVPPGCFGIDETLEPAGAQAPAGHDGISLMSVGLPWAGPISRRDPGREHRQTGLCQMVLQTAAAQPPAGAAPTAARRLLHFRAIPAGGQLSGLRLDAGFYGPPRQPGQMDRSGPG